jgi:hypothetical protein
MEHIIEGPLPAPLTLRQANSIARTKLTRLRLESDEQRGKKGEIQVTACDRRGKIHVPETSVRRQGCRGSCPGAPA